VAVLREVREAEEREAAEIREAMVLVEEAIERERQQQQEEERELEWALKAVAALSADADGAVPEAERPAAPAAHDAPTEERQSEPAGGERGESGPEAQPAETEAYRAAAVQLRQLVELGFPEPIAATYCDGVTPLEEIVEQIVHASGTADAPGAAPVGASDGSSTPRWRVPKAPFHWAAKRLSGK